MNQKEQQSLIKALKSLKNDPSAGWPCSSAVERMDNRVMSYIKAQTTQPEHSSGLFYLKMVGYFVPPKFVYAMGIIAFLITSGTVAAASRNALPGDTLYSAKLAVEKVQVRFTSNPARRAVIQMELAGNRLKELRQIKDQGGVMNGRADSALSRFTKDVTEINSVLKQAGDPEQVKTATSEIAQKATEYKEELANLGQEETDSSGFIVPPEKKQVRSVDLAAIEKAEQALQGVGVVDNNIGEVQKDDVLEDGQVGL